MGLREPDSSLGIRHTCVEKKFCLCVPAYIIHLRLSLSLVSFESKILIQVDEHHHFHITYEG